MLSKKQKESCFFINIQSIKAEYASFSFILNKVFGSFRALANCEPSFGHLFDLFLYLGPSISMKKSASCVTYACNSGGLLIFIYF